MHASLSVLCFSPKNANCNSFPFTSAIGTDPCEMYHGADTLYSLLTRLSSSNQFPDHKAVVQTKSYHSSQAPLESPATNSARKTTSSLSASVLPPRPRRITRNPHGSRCFLNRYRTHAASTRTEAAKREQSHGHPREPLWLPLRQLGPASRETCSKYQPGAQRQQGRAGQSPVVVPAPPTPCTANATACAHHCQRRSPWPSGRGSRRE